MEGCQYNDTLIGFTDKSKVQPEGCGANMAGKIIYKYHTNIVL